MYESLTTPAAAGHLHFAGEALSTRHAWVEGALDSAWRAVFEILLVEPAWQRLIGKFFRNWGYNGEWWRSASQLGGKEGMPRPRVPNEGGGRKGGPVFGGPAGDSEEGEDGDGEIDVDEILKGSLLPQHLVAAQPGTFYRA